MNPKIPALFFIFGAVILVGSLVVLFIVEEPCEDETKTVPCYDREYNKIKEVTCEEKTCVYDRNTPEKVLIAFAIIGGLLILTGMVTAQFIQGGTY